ncbi:uncharacterized protein PITG_16194 [Phytophthora infestans T30-4]|uniref:Uncharacterized protein n=1 Tax=Phytophthora infestans (strain T30-4) TaxID=403677 RepID=D0NTC4_PHYIT|nr:uncharacterized protein PITG_16194 [Phytophthora infestans T30-4]EEY64875.1 conserved hypothetical protein [Phytophthora infestans T30-4]|eukprot:XP_002897605.1 conserved hypothetical protein [Phytophthora infestans T30-4]
MKACCRLVVENLQPPVLKAQIGRRIDLERRDCKSDDVALFDLILEHAKVQQRFHRISQDYAGKQDSKTIKPEKKPQREHWLNDCPTGTDAQREEAVKKFRAAKERRSGPLLDVPYTPDTGADKSVTTSLSTPIETVMADGRVQLFKQEVKLDLELTTVASFY